MKTKRFFAILTAVLILAVSLAGCKADEDMKEKILLPGSWKYSKSDGGGYVELERTILTFNDEDKSYESVFSKFYENNTSIQFYKITLNGTYTIGNKILSSLANGETVEVYELDILVNSFELEPVTDAGVQHLNDGAFFGFTDWTLNTPKSIAGLEGMPQQGGVIYDIFYILDDNLFIGKGQQQDKLTPESRPTTLQDLPYFRIAK